MSSRHRKIEIAVEIASRVNNDTVCDNCGGDHETKDCTWPEGEIKVKINEPVYTGGTRTKKAKNPIPTTEPAPLPNNDNQ